jgi:2-succinyl-5-enolpyruvyl-6-hydroxy-3-cyclohexene-1-carboxylate synthase
MGVSQVCIAPGSRSTPLTLEADANPKLTLHHHFDERGLGFLALGLAKASQRPVAVIVTSGTAVANLLPAAVEANLTGEKLILLTADRPQELVGCGANQAIVQTGIFSSHVTGELNLPSPNATSSLSWLLTSIDEQLIQQDRNGGVIHINCPFPEPLYTQDTIDYTAFYNPTLMNWSTQGTPFVQYLDSTQKTHAQGVDFNGLNQRKGLIILGQLTLEEAEIGVKLARDLGWPIWCDPQSGVNSEWGHYDLWLQNKKLAQGVASCDCIVQIGPRLVSKRLLAWLKQQVSEKGANYLYISPTTQRNNSHHLPQTHIVTDVTSFSAAWSDALVLSDSLHHGWAVPLSNQLIAVERYLSQCDADAPISEIAVAQAVARFPPNADLFIGNSLIVRLLDMVVKLNHRPTFSNRGASGIDGLVATAVGVQRARNQSLVMLLGDTSLLYDLNSLALVAKQSLPFVVIVTNNDGGAIFDLLPVPQQQKSNLYTMPHGFEFHYAAAQFGLHYALAHTQSDLIEFVNQHITDGTGGLLIEVHTANQQVSTLINQLVSGIYAL